MPKAFLDSDMIIALYNKNDLLHEKALNIFQNNIKEKWNIFLSTNILLESLTIVRQRISKEVALKILDEFRLGTYNIIHPSQEEIFLAESFFKSIKTKNISYSDCVSFAIMKTNKISKIFSFDKHFKKEGFIRIDLD